MFAYAFAHSATQTINLNAPDPLEIAVQDDTSLAVWVQQPDGRQHQYFSQFSWGNILWLNGTETSDSHASNYLGGGFNAVSNTLTGTGTSADPWRITTTASVEVTGVSFTQIITYVNGDRQIGKTFVIENNGSTTWTDLRFIHGGDSFFGGNDSARSWWDAENRMIYIHNNDFTNQGIMGFYGSPATPADHYFGGSFSLGRTQAQTKGRLNDTANANFVDAGYYLEWDRETLAPGQTWSITAYEFWSEPTFLQVIAPANAFVKAGTSLTHNFKVHNLNSATQDIDLTVSSAPLGWTVSLPDGASIQANSLEVMTVPVEIVVPAGATPGDVEKITLEAETLDGSVTVEGASFMNLTVLDLDVSITPDPANFGSVEIGSSATRTVSFSNNSSSDVTLGTVNISGSGYSIVSDNASGQTIPIGQTRALQVQFAPVNTSDANGTLSWPVTDPVAAILNSDLQGTVEPVQPPPSPTPEPVLEENRYEFTATTLHLLDQELDPNGVLGNSVSTTLLSGSLPAGLEIVGTRLTGRLASTGTYHFVISQMSGDDEVRSEVTIVVMVPTVTPMISGIWVADEYVPMTVIQESGYGDAAVTELFHVDTSVGKQVDLLFHWDYIKEPTSFRIVGGSLPPGLELVETEHNGVPTARIQGIAEQAGEYTFVVSVKDWRGRGYQWIYVRVQ